MLYKISWGILIICTNKLSRCLKSNLSVSPIVLTNLKGTEIYLLGYFCSSKLLTEVSYIICVSCSLFQSCGIYYAILPNFGLMAF